MDLSCQYRKEKEPPSQGASEHLDMTWLARTLPPVELDLFNHYLEHTSRDPDPAADSRDTYALQIGIPRLACENKPLMRSVLALAAVCKCCDIINAQPPAGHQEPDRRQVVDLLTLAHQFHLDSLHKIRATLQQAENYDHVLANAAMMGMYGSASHCARIWLAKTAVPGELDGPLCGDLFMPGHPQWLSLFRAVRLAYAGLLNDNTPPYSPVALTTESDTPGYCRNVLRSLAAEEQQPKPRTVITHPLGPILAATVGSAMAKLNDRARKTQALVQATAGDSDNGDAELEACFTALAILADIITSTLFHPSDSSTSSPNPSTTPTHNLSASPPIITKFGVYDPVKDPLGRLSQVSPWLRRYTASISSMTPSTVPRRTIMSFVHKVPRLYLNLVEEVVGLMSSRHDPLSSATSCSTSSSSSPTLSTPPPPCSPSPRSLLSPTPHLHVNNPNDIHYPQPNPGKKEEPQQRRQHHHQQQNYHHEQEPLNNTDPHLNPTQPLALEIFAHWLVLVTLLDQVWWLGSIGAWELGRIVASVRTRRTTTTTTTTTTKSGSNMMNRHDDTSICTCTCCGDTCDEVHTSNNTANHNIPCEDVPNAEEVKGQDSPPPG